jgi:hypothetical protein
MGVNGEGGGGVASAFACSGGEEVEHRLEAYLFGYWSYTFI